MATSSHMRRESWLAILGGICWIAFHLYFIFSGVDYRELGASILLVGLAVVLMALAVLAILRRPILNVGGRIGAGVLLVGMILVSLGAIVTGLDLWEGAWLLVIGGEAVTALGLVSFSMGALMEAPAASWKWLPLLMAPFYFLSFSTTSTSFPSWAPAYTPEWLAVAYGFGWVLLGLLLLSAEREPKS